MIKCPSCGGELDYKVENQMVKCKYCQTEFNPAELNVTVKHAKERTNPLVAEGKSYSCTQCGATLLTFDDTAITFCSYCGSQAMLEDKMMGKVNPDYVIPFMKNKDECIEAYKKKISSSAFVPDYMKSDTVVEKFRGIFMPYAIYKVGHKGKETSKGSKYTHTSGDYKYYDDYNVSFDLDAEYDGISYDLSSNYYDKFSTAIPFDIKDKKDFNPNYLVGFYADTSNVESETYDTEAVTYAVNDSVKKLVANKEFSQYGCSAPVVKYEVKDRKIAMFPVYFLAIRDKANKNINYAVVNGQTGKVAMDLPVAFGKYVRFSLILAVVIFLLINRFIILTPKVISIFSLIFAIISIIMSVSQAKKINKRKYHLDDKGYLNANKDKNEEVEKVNMMKYIFKDMFAILLPLLVLVFNFVEDAYYYGSSIISLLLVLLSFKDLVDEHNLLVSNKIPQLDKRGGDEN